MNESIDPTRGRVHDIKTLVFFAQKESGKRARAVMLLPTVTFFVGAWISLSEDSVVWATLTVGASLLLLTHAAFSDVYHRLHLQNDLTVEQTKQLEEIEQRLDDRSAQWDDEP